MPPGQPGSQAEPDLTVHPCAALAPGVEAAGALEEAAAAQSPASAAHCTMHCLQLPSASPQRPDCPGCCMSGQWQQGAAAACRCGGCSRPLCSWAPSACAPSSWPSGCELDCSGVDIQAACSGTPAALSRSEACSSDDLPSPRLSQHAVQCTRPAALAETLYKSAWGRDACGWCRVQYGQSLESNTFHDSTADYVYFFLICMGACLVRVPSTSTAAAGCPSALPAGVRALSAAALPQPSWRRPRAACQRCM